MSIYKLIYLGEKKKLIQGIYLEALWYKAG